MLTTTSPHTYIRRYCSIVSVAHIIYSLRGPWTGTRKYKLKLESNQTADILTDIRSKTRRKCSKSAYRTVQVRGHSRHTRSLGFNSPSSPPSALTAPKWYAIAEMACSSPIIRSMGAREPRRTACPRSRVRMRTTGSLHRLGREAVCPMALALMTWPTVRSAAAADDSRRR